MAYELKKEPNPEIATRTGEFAMLIYSIGEYRFVHIDERNLIYNFRSWCRRWHDPTSSRLS